MVSIFRQGGVKNLLLIALWVLGGVPVGADEFEVGSVIHPVVAKLEPPEMIEGFGEGQMAITTSSDQAARHFAQGLTLLNASWDFEAYRHFCEAVKLDPDCLMAYWGIGFCLAGNQHEFFAERKGAIDRMLDLLEAEKESGQDRWNAMETGFVKAAGLLLTDGGRAAGETFKAVAEKFPANQQARMFSLLFLQDGYDSTGRPGPGQERANEGLRQLLAENPDDLSVMSVWVNSQADAPGQVPRLREEVLPVARRLVERYPDYPPFHLMRAHAEARCGNAREGLAAATRARGLYEDYLEKEKVTIYDCGGLVRARLYQGFFNEALGDRAQALAVADDLAAMKVNEDRLFSEGAILLMWEGRTLAVRLVMNSSTKEGLVAGRANLQKLPEEAWFQEKSFAIYYRDCLGFYLAVRLAIADGELAVGKRLFDQFLLRVRAFEQNGGLAAETAFAASWRRAMVTLSAMVPEARGLLAGMEKGATRLTAANWFQSARDRQGRPGNLMPPSIPYPMEWRLGNHALRQEDDEKAVKWYREGLALRPNQLDLLRGLQRALQKLGENEKANEVAETIKAISK